MSNFYKNIFYYYRGTKESDSTRERQLEDNTTKALINTLQHGGNEVTRKFLKWLGVEEAENIQFSLQKQTIGKGTIRRKKQRILLAIVPTKGKQTNLNETNRIDSRPDAWIYGNNFVILIESKVVGYIDAEQIRYHFNKLRVDSQDTPEFYEKTWADIHSFFSALSLDMAGKSRWIINHSTFGEVNLHPQ